MAFIIDLSTIKALLPCNCRMTNTSDENGKRIDIWTPLKETSYDYPDMLRMLYSAIGYELIAEILKSKNDRLLIVYFINEVILVSEPHKRNSIQIEVYRDYPIHLVACRNRYTYFYIDDDNKILKVPFVNGHSRRYNNALSEIKRIINDLYNVTSPTLPGA
jgi:hypothetical protein